MKLYRLYLSFAIKNALRFPRRAFKILPGLALTLVGAGFLLFTILTTTTQEATIFDTLSALTVPLFSLLALMGMTLYGMYGNKGVAGARAADASLLMPAPLTPFQFYTFINFKQLSNVIGLVFLASVYSGASIAYLPHPSLILVIYAAVLLLLYIFSNVDYIAKTTTHVWGIHLKHLIAGLFTGFITVFTLTIINQGAPALLTSPVLLYYPLIGWCFGLMVGLATGELFLIGIFTGLLVISYIATLHLAKQSTYNYYEEELTSVQKIEAAYQRAYSNKGIELKTKFVQTNRKITHINEQVLLDIAWIRAGKRWYLQFGPLFKLVLLSIVAYFIFNSENSKQTFAAVMSIALGYVRFFSIRTHDDTPNNDPYLALMPLKIRYKLLYPLVVHFYRSLLYGILYVLALLILSFVTVSPIDIFSISLWGIVIILFDIFDLLLVKLLYPMTTQRFLGNFLQSIISMVVVLGSQALVFFTVIKFPNITFGLIGGIVMLTILSAVVLYFSVKIYHHTEKGKKEEINF